MLKTAKSAAAGFLLCLFLAPSASLAKERNAEVALRFDLKAPEEAKIVRLWIPYPISNENQIIKDVSVQGNFSQSGIFREDEHGNTMLYAEWDGPSKERTLTYTFKVTRKEVVRKDFPGRELPLSKQEFKEYLKATGAGPIGGNVKELAAKITKDKETVLEKSRAIYDWIVENMHRDPNVKGCGFGQVEQLLVSLGGKCADIHSVFVALSRAAGVPAREVFGIRIPKGKEGEMTKAQHCWAEFYLPGYGWVPADPADVRKAILEQKLTLDQAKSLREYFFGAVDESRIGYGRGRDVILNPPQSGAPLNYFMYPYAEADGKPLNEDLYGFNIGYKIIFKEL